MRARAALARARALARLALCLGVALALPPLAPRAQAELELQSAEAEQQLPGAPEAAAPQDPEEHPVELRARLPWPRTLNHGWMPVQLELENRSPRTWPLQLEGGGWFGGSSVTTELVLAPLETRRIELLLPAFPASGTLGGASYRFSVRGGHPSFRLLSQTVGYDVDARIRSGIVALADPAEAGQTERWEAAIATATYEDSRPGASGASTTKTPNLDLGECLYAELPASAAAYSSLDIAILPLAAQLPPRAQLEPLVSWLRLGGRVALFGPGARAAAERIDGLREWLEPRFEVETEDLAAVRVFACGLGAIAIGEVELDEWSAKNACRWLLQFAPDAQPAQHQDGLRPRASDWLLAIPGVGEPPLRAFAVVLFLFWLLIGPINFYVVGSRLKKPALLLVTIPALAILFSVGLVLYGIVDQGISTISAVRSATLLDQRTHAAACLDVRQLFIGLSAGDGLEPAAGTICFPMYGAETAGRTGPPDRTRHYEILEGERALLAGDFTPLRTPYGLQTLSERSLRARCEFTRSGEQAQFVNGFDSALRELVVCDADGQWWRAADELQAGARVELERIAAEQGAQTQALMSVADAPLLHGHSLVRGSYIALLREAAHLDGLGLDAEEKLGQHVVLGILEAQGEAR